MNSKELSRSGIVLAVSVLGLLLLVAAALPVGAERWLGEAWSGPARDVAAAPQNGTNVAYVGAVELEWAMPGKLSDPLPTPTPDPDPQAPPPPDLGEIDLALELIRTGDTITGYVDLEFTLVFTNRHEIGSVWYGPSVEGTFDGERLRLSSERVPLDIAGKQVERKFRLRGDAVPGQEGTLRGQYRETIWGYAPQPLTVIGTFTLQEAIANLGPGAGFGASPIAGQPPLKVAFEDLSTGDPSSWQWDFGDGGSSTEQHPEHTYTEPGSYTVKLTVSNALSSDTLTVPDRVIVKSGKVYLPVVLRSAGTQ